MRWKKRVEQALAIGLTLALAFSLNVPLVAWGEEGSGEATAAQTDDSTRGSVSSVGPLRIFYALDNGAYQEVGSSSDEGAWTLEALQLDPSSFGSLHLKIEPGEGYSFGTDAAIQVTSVSVGWQAVTDDGMTIAYGAELRSEEGALRCDVPSDLLRNVSSTDYEYFRIGWVTDKANPGIHGSAFGTYQGHGLLKAGEALSFNSASLMGTYRSENGAAVVLATSPEGKRTCAIEDEVSSDGSPAVASFNSVSVSCNSMGEPTLTQINVNYGANAWFALGVDGEGNRTLSSMGDYTYRTAAGAGKGAIAKGQTFTRVETASVGEATYSTLQEAVDAAQPGDTVKLLKDVGLDGGPRLAISGKQIVLDLGGFTLKRTGGVLATSNSKVTIANGVVEGEFKEQKGEDWVAAVTAGRGSELTIAENAELIGPFGISVGPLEGDFEAATSGQGTVVDIYGKVNGTSDAQALAYGGSGAVTINGQVRSTEEGRSPRIHVHAGARLTGVRGTDPNVNFADAPAIYAAGFGQWVIDEGAVLSADEPLSIKSGKFTINGGTFEARGVYCSPAEAFDNGTEATGAAISITKSNSYVGQVSMDIFGGTFTSENGYALYESDSLDNEGSPMKSNTALSIEGGVFKGDKGAVLSKHLTGFAKGGTFSSDVSAYMADGRIISEKDGLFSVEPDQVAIVTKPDGTKTTYNFLSNALRKAQDGDIVTLLKDVPTGNSRYDIGSSITLDLNGFSIGGTKFTTLLVNKYEGTIDVTVKNGSITNSSDGSDNVGLGVAIFARQGVDLTLENVVLDAVNTKVGVPGYGLRIGNVDKTNPTVRVTGEKTRIVGTDAGVSVIGGNVEARPFLIVEDGVIEGGNFGIAGNGGCDGTGIEIRGGVVRATSEEGCALYHPQDGDLTISGGALEGANGVQFSGAGKVSVEGGQVEATAAQIAEPDTSVASASIFDGAALSIVSRGGGYGAAGSAEVSVSGGTLTSLNNVALREYAVDGVGSLVKSMSIAQAQGKLLEVASGAGKPAVSLATLDGDAAAKVVTGGTFSSDVSAFYDASIYSQNAQDALDNPGAVVPRAFEIRYELAGGSLPAGAPVSYTYFDGAIALANPERSGYTFAGWTGTALDAATTDVVIPANSTGDRAYTATWTPNADTAYTVEHWFQDVEGDGYAQDESKTEKLAGTTDAATAAQALEEPGFTAKAFEQRKILGDGSTVVEVRYDRNVHKVTYEYAGAVPAGASALPADQEVRYGAPVVVAGGATAPGYDFVGWGVSEGLTMPDEDLVLKGSFVARGDTAYKTEHYQQNLDGTYKLASIDDLAGMTGSAATAVPKAYEGFALNENAEGTVARGVVEGDGSLVLKLYYDRNSYEVFYAYAGDVPVGAPAAPGKVLAKFGQTVEPAAAPTMTGYDFSGWSRAEAFAMPAENVVVTGSWTARADAGYTVRYFADGGTRKLADDKQVAGLTFGKTYEEAAPAIPGYTVKGASVQNVEIDAYGKEVSFLYTADEARIAFEANGGSRVDDIVGATDAQVTGSLPRPSRGGYAFAGWYAEKGLVTPVTELPTVFPVGTTTYYAKWNVIPLPEVDIEIQVDVPTDPGDGTAHATVTDETVKTAAVQAQSAVETITDGGVPAGMGEADAASVKKVIDSAASDDEVSIVVAIKAELKLEEEVDDSEKAAVEGASAEGEEVALYLDLSVSMIVQVTSDGEVKDRREVPLDEVDEPMLFEIHVDPALIQGKSVRIAHVHHGATEVIYPESVDRERGIVRVYASAFSTYALLASQTCSVTFESNGGTAVEAQEVAFGDTVAKPADPAREGFAFAGWFADEACAQAYDFASPFEGPLALYAKWTAVVPDPGPDPDPDPAPDPDPDPDPAPDPDPEPDPAPDPDPDPDPVPDPAPDPAPAPDPDPDLDPVPGDGPDAGDAPKDGPDAEAKPLPRAEGLVSTGDPVGAAAAGAAALSLGAFAVLGAAALRRRRTR